MGTQYNPRAKAMKTIEVLAVPEQILTASTTIIECGKGRMLRIKGVADGFIRFTDDVADTTTPTSSTKETLETEAGYFKVISTGKYIIASTSMRVEIIGD